MHVSLSSLPVCGSRRIMICSFCQACQSAATGHNLAVFVQACQLAAKGDNLSVLSVFAIWGSRSKPGHFIRLISLQHKQTTFSFYQACQSAAKEDNLFVISRLTVYVISRQPVRFIRLVRLQQQETTCPFCQGSPSGALDSTCLLSGLSVCGSRRQSPEFFSCLSVWGRRRQPFHWIVLVGLRQREKTCSFYQACQSATAGDDRSIWSDLSVCSTRKTCSGGRAFRSVATGNNLYVALDLSVGGSGRRHPVCSSCQACESAVGDNLFFFFQACQYVATRDNLFAVSGGGRGVRLLQ